MTARATMLGAVTRLSPLFALASLPTVARACPVCFAARDEAERLALLGTTVFLTALPVIMIGAIIYWVVRRSSQPEAPPLVEAAQEAARDSGEHRMIAPLSSSAEAPPASKAPVS